MTGTIDRTDPGCRTAPRVEGIRNHRKLHQMYARWPDHHLEPAHAVFWATTDGRIVLKGMISNGMTRGRDMLKWIGQTYGRPIHVVEVLPTSQGFWERMQAEGVIASWEPSDGHANPLERMAEPLVQDGRPQ